MQIASYLSNTLSTKLVRGTPLKNWFKFGFRRSILCGKNTAKYSLTRSVFATSSTTGEPSEHFKCSFIIINRVKLTLVVISCSKFTLKE